MASHRRYRLNQLVDEAIHTRVKLQQIRIDLSSVLLEEPRKAELECALTKADQESRRVLVMLRDQLLHGELVGAEED
jgi:hypothetical protein